MQDKGASAPTYGQVFAGVYERWNADRVPTAEVAFLGPMVKGTALELGSGTGRVAIRLAEHTAGHVIALDGSRLMLAQQSAPESGDCTPVCADFTALPLAPASINLVFILYSSITLAITQEDQCRVLAEAARVLKQGGLLVIECFVPNLERYHDTRQSVEVDSFLPDSAVLNLVLHDALRQQLHVRRVELGQDGAQLYPFTLRYIWPSELDLMAASAGLRLLHDFRGFDSVDREGHDPMRVAVYAK